ncbi:universal stress protein [Mucilaginibacter celer]|uniref:Uncharacterized protein n=1 Tax=Mucilaginibacter celer TaxID=2305508 RepID=A0A494VWL1_9SPHI|nr:universal stress protein [Mucilaginibacter celer]AYL95688.1 hypothetical protein HYN43_010480 [Mucilaginibacter celer]
MKSILVIHNLKSESRNALAYASELSEKLNVKVVVTYTVPESRSLSAQQTVPEDSFLHDEVNVHEHNHVADHVISLSYIDTLGMSIHELTVKYDTGIIIKGVSGTAQAINEELKTILHHTSCPVLAVPEDVNFSLRNIGYLTDLRFAKKNITCFINQFTSSTNTKAKLFNVAELGVPHMHDAYAQTVFAQSFGNYNLGLMNIREREVAKTIDVLTNIMQVDLFVLSNRSSQLNAVWEHYDAHAGQPHAHFPVLIFPC